MERAPLPGSRIVAGSRSKNTKAKCYERRPGKKCPPGWDFYWGKCCPPPNGD